MPNLHGATPVDTCQGAVNWQAGLPTGAVPSGTLCALFASEVEEGAVHVTVVPLFNSSMILLSPPDILRMARQIPGHAHPSRVSVMAALACCHVWRLTLPGSVVQEEEAVATGHILQCRNSTECRRVPTSTVLVSAPWICV